MTPVSFQVENPEYFVTIPASVEMDETGKDSLPLSCTQLEGCNHLTVDSANGMKLKGEAGTIAYTLTASNGTAILNGNTAATFTGTRETALNLAVAECQILAPGSNQVTLTRALEPGEYNGMMYVQSYRMSDKTPTNNTDTEMVLFV